MIFSIRRKTSTLSYNSERLFRVLYKWLLALMVLYIVFIPFCPNHSFILRLPTMCTAMCIAIVYLFCQTYKYIDIISCFIIFGIIFLNYLLYPATLEPETIYRTCGFIAYVILIVTSDAVKLDHKTISFTYTVCILTTFVLFLYSFSSFSHWDTKRYVDELTLGFYNPNFTGFILFFLFSLIFICSPSKHKWFSWIFEGILLYLLFQTQSRTSLISAILIPLLSSFAKQRPFPNWIIVLVCSIPFLFVKVYLEMYHNLGNNFTFFGKTFFSGREITFYQYLDNIITPLHYLIGHGESQMFANAHNGPLSIFSSIGIIGSICFFGIIFEKIFSCNKRINTRQAFSAILVLLVCFVYSCTEDGCFAGGFPLLIFMYIFFVFANHHNQDNPQSFQSSNDILKREIKK